MASETNQFGSIPAERTDGYNDRSACMFGILVAVGVCSIFWFAVGIGLGWYIAR